MSLRTDAYYRDVAAGALERVGCAEPPIPIDEIVASLGIPVRPVNLPQFFTSAAVYEDGLPVFIVNWAKSEQERRLAIAHMLGHVLLVLAGEGNTYPRESGDHRDADLVARELMLPAAMVIDQARLWFNDYRYLARLFGVGEEQMLERMRDMGMIKGPQGVMWDY
jgi:Zn-dependent peptidase ImmA (M78 family)